MSTDNRGGCGGVIVAGLLVGALGMCLLYKKDEPDQNAHTYTGQRCRVRVGSAPFIPLLPSASAVQDLLKSRDIGDRAGIYEAGLSGMSIENGTLVLVLGGD